MLVRRALAAWLAHARRRFELRRLLATFLSSSQANIQLAVFEAQVALAAELSLPLFVHLRERDADKGEVGSRAPLHPDTVGIVGRGDGHGLVVEPSIVIGSVKLDDGRLDERRRHLHPEALVGRGEAVVRVQFS